MMTVRILLPVLIGTVNHAPGDLVEATDLRAADLIAHGAAVAPGDAPAAAPGPGPDPDPAGDGDPPAPSRKARPRPARGRPGEPTGAAE